MLMKPNNKNAATIIVSKLREQGPEVEKSMESEGAEQEVDQFEMAAEELLGAIERKDSRALKEALKSFIQMCEYEEEEAD